MLVNYLQCSNLSNTYGEHVVLNGLDLCADQGTINCVVGPSGSGKSTFLRCLLGLESCTTGTIILDSQLLKNGATETNRHIGMIFQEHILFPHMTVRENIRFGIKDINKLEKYAKDCQCIEYLDKYPHELSGGETQRVALAQLLALEPKLLLMDEPFAHLDPILRHSLWIEVKKVISFLHITCIIVTHDYLEAFYLSDKINVFINGKNIQSGTPEQVYDYPCNKYIASLTGDVNVLKLNSIQKGCKEGQYVMLRPEDVEIGHDGIDATLQDVHFQGSTVCCVFKLCTQEVVRMCVPRSKYPVPQKTKLIFKHKKENIFSDE